MPPQDIAEYDSLEEVLAVMPDPEVETVFNELINDDGLWDGPVTEPPRETRW